jgi:uncharacterized protein with PIN domain
MLAQTSHERPTRAAEFRFYEELNDFLPAARRKLAFMFPFQGTPAVRDLIQAIGVPHTEIDLVLVDGRSVDFTHRLRGGERVAVYPTFERLDISPLLRLRPRPLREARFILDVHLGKLARHLRLLGLDCAYRQDWDDATLIDHALAERRIILTRDVGILKHGRVTHGYWVRSHQPARQLEEIVEAFDLRRQLAPFTRCLECNGVIGPVDRTELEDRVQAAILVRFEQFWQCPVCHRVYWQGSHYRRLLQCVRRLAPERCAELSWNGAGDDARA